VAAFTVDSHCCKDFVPKVIDNNLGGYLEM